MQPRSQPEPRPEQAPLDRVGEIGDRRERVLHKRQQPPQRAAALNGDRAQLYLVAVAGPDDPAQFANSVDQTAIERLAAGKDVAVEQGLVGSIDFSGTAAADLFL